MGRVSAKVPIRKLLATDDVYDRGFHKGDPGGLAAVDTDLIAANIKLGVTVFGIAGEMVSWVYDLLAETGEPAVLSIPAPSVSLAVVDSPGGGVTAPEGLAVPAPVLSSAVVATILSAVEGAVAHDDDGVDTDETTEANEATADDMTLLQADGAVADWYGLGDATQFDGILLNVSTVGADITLATFEYSKGGAAWGTLTVSRNELNDYETSGMVRLIFERPGDWAVDTYAGIADKYWIKLKPSVVGAGFVQPLGAQAWILVYA